MGSLAVIGCHFGGCGGADAGPAVNQFEIKDLDVDVGNLQFQSQNAFSTGQPKRHVTTSASGEPVVDDNSVARERYAQELEAHLTSFFRMRVGIEFERQRLDDPKTLDKVDSYDALKLSELAIEGVVVLVPPKNGFGVGLIAEYQHPMSSRESATLFMGTILQAVQGPWSVTADLFLVRHFSPLEFNEAGEPYRDNKWDFAYASQLKYKYSEQWSFAVEAYGTVDRIANSGTRDESSLLLGDHDQHRVGPIVYYNFKTHAGRLKDHLRAPAKSIGADDVDGVGAGKVRPIDSDDDEPMATIGFGVLAGVTPDTPQLTYKLSLEVEF